MRKNCNEVTNLDTAKSKQHGFENACGISGDVQTLRNKEAQ